MLQNSPPGNLTFPSSHTLRWLPLPRNSPNPIGSPSPIGFHALHHLYTASSPSTNPIKRNFPPTIVVPVPWFPNSLVNFHALHHLYAAESLSADPTKGKSPHVVTTSLVLPLPYRCPLSRQFPLFHRLPFPTILAVIFSPRHHILPPLGSSLPWPDGPVLLFPWKFFLQW